MDLATFRRVVHRRRRVLAASASLVFGVAVGAFLLMDTQYVASATLRARTASVVTEGIVRPDSLDYVDRLRSTYADYVETSSFREGLNEAVGSGSDLDPSVQLPANSELLEISVLTADEGSAVLGANTAAGLLIDRVRSQDEAVVAEGDEEFAQEQSAREERIAQLDAQLTELAGADPDDPQVSSAVAQLEARLATEQQVAARLAAEHSAWRTQVLERARSLAVVSPADVVEPAGPSLALVVPAALVAGLIVGLALALLVENLSDQVHETSEAAALLGFERPADPRAGPAAESADDAVVVLAEDDVTATSASRRLALKMERVGRRAVILLDDPRSAVGDPLLHRGDGVPGLRPVDPEAVPGALPVFTVGPDDGSWDTDRATVVEKAVVELKERYDLVIVVPPARREGNWWTVTLAAVPAVVYAMAPHGASRDGIRAVRDLLDEHGGRVSAVLPPPTRHDAILGTPAYATGLPSWTWATVPTRTDWWTRAAKRGLDLCLGTLLLVLAAPVLFLVGLAVRLDSPGPAIFRQNRVGARRRSAPDSGSFWEPEVFRMHKFRTMKVDADQTVHVERIERYANGETIAEAGPRSKPEDDERVTRLGRRLRRWSIDELPQLWDVVIGRMSLVGPRPVPTYEADHYTASQLGRFATKPGMTGLWQVSGRSDLSFDDAVACDLEYVARQSVLLDLRILARTLGTIWSRKGAA